MDVKYFLRYVVSLKGLICYVNLHWPMYREIMFQLLSIFTTITGLFTLLDLFVEKNAKAKVAEYVFGFGSANLAGFEYNTINALLSPLKIDGRLSYKRVLFRYSAIIAILINVIPFFGIFLFPEKENSDSISILNEILEVAFYIPLMTLVFWPFDCWSLWVTNKIFSVKKSSSLFSFIGRVLSDVLITLLPLAIATAGFYSLVVLMGLFTENALKTGIAYWIFYGTLFFIILNLLGSLLVTIAQLLTLILGVFLRAILRLTKLNQHIAMISRAHEFPFTFIGLVLGVLGAVSAVILT